MNIDIEKYISTKQVVTKTKNTICMQGYQDQSTSSFVEPTYLKPSNGSSRENNSFISKGTQATDKTALPAPHMALSDFDNAPFTLSRFSGQKHETNETPPASAARHFGSNGLSAVSPSLAS